MIDSMEQEDFDIRNQQPVTYCSSEDGRSMDAC